MKPAQKKLWEGLPRIGHWRFPSGWNATFLGVYEEHVAGLDVARTASEIAGKLDAVSVTLEAFDNNEWSMPVAL